MCNFLTISRSTKSKHLTLVLLPLVVFLIGCSPQSDSVDVDDSKKSRPVEAPHAGTIGGPIFIPSSPETFEIKKRGYGAGTAFALRSEKPISRVDVMVTYEPPQESSSRLELVNEAFESDLSFYRNQNEIKFTNEIVPTKSAIDLDSKSRSDFVLEFSNENLPDNNKMFVRTIVFFDNHFFHVRIQADSEETLAELTAWASNIQYFGESDENTGE